MNIQNNNEGKQSTVKTTLFFAVCELIVSALVVAVYLVIDKFTFKVLTGVLLGSTVIILNILLLSISVNRAVDSYMDKLGNKERTDEEAEKFAKENGMRVQNAATVSYIIRTVSMLAALLLAFFLTDVFDVIATVIPLLMFRPIIYLNGLMERKKEKSLKKGE